MAKYIVLANWTDQGIRSVKDSAKRLDAGSHWPASRAASMKISL